MAETTGQMPESHQSKAARIAGRAIASLAALALIATCVILLFQRKADVAAYPAMCAAVIGYLILRPGKRSIRLSGGGVVVDVVSDDTGVIRTGVNAVMERITQEISEKTISQVRQSAQPPPIPEDNK